MLTLIIIIEGLYWVLCAKPYVNIPFTHPWAATRDVATFSRSYHFPLLGWCGQRSQTLALEWVRSAMRIMHQSLPVGWTLPGTTPLLVCCPCSILPSCLLLGFLKSTSIIPKLLNPRHRLRFQGTQLRIFLFFSKSISNLHQRGWLHSCFCQW